MKEFRMQRMMYCNKSISVLALDHGLSNGLIKGLESPLNILGKMCELGCKNILVNKGVAFDMVREKSNLGTANIILNMSAGLNFANLQTEKFIFTTLETAIKLDAVAVAIQIIFNSELSPNCIKELGMLIDEAYRWEIPILAMVYIDKNFPFNIVDAVRIIEEMGADMVKIARPKEDDECKIINNTKIPVLLAGGEYDDAPEYEKRLKEVLKIGYKGVVVGRNIFQRTNPKRMMKKIMDIVEERK